MSDPTTAAAKTTTTAKTTAVKKKLEGKGMNKTWLIVGVLIVLVLGGVNIYYMKKNKELKEKLEAANASSNSGSGDSIETRETDETDAAPQDREPAGGSNPMGDPK